MWLLPFLICFSFSNFITRLPALTAVLKLYKFSYRPQQVVNNLNMQNDETNHKVIRLKDIIRNQINQYVKISASLFVGLSGLTIWNYSNEDQKRNQITKELFQQNIKPGMNVLEVGFGEGVNLDFYPRFINLTVLDPKVEITESQFNKYCDKAIDLHLINGVCESLPFSDSNFDVVVSTLVFCTVANPLQCLQEISRVLKPGGVFVSIEHILADEDETNSLVQVESPSVLMIENTHTGTREGNVIPKNSLLSSQQIVLDPLQVVVAHGCHLNRHTDNLFMSSLISSNQSLTSSSSLFSSIIQFRYEEFSSQWPISRQIFVCLRKA
jgi:SAM-dependent methyltransferase